METSKKGQVWQSTYLTLVEKIYQEHNKPMRYNGSLESMLRELFCKTSRKKYLWKRNTLKALLVHLYHQKCYALLRQNHYLNVLYNISAFGDKLVRPIDTWQNDTFDNRGKLNSLIKHCFEKFETPEFFIRSFYYNNKTHMLWYIQLAKGKSVKKLSSMPITLTNKMAHEFRNANSCSYINQALRYAQAKGFGASNKNAQLIASSRLSNIKENEEAFWQTVIQFFAKEKELNRNQFYEMVDYISHKYNEDESFTMKGRTLNALWNQSQTWHREVFLKQKVEELSWNSSGIKPLCVEEIEDNQKVIYKTIELLNSTALYLEGYEMKHCVATYDEGCKEGRCIIFSLVKKVEGKSEERLATLEIELPSNEIVQAQAKYNQRPDAKSLELIKDWVKGFQMN